MQGPREQGNEGLGEQGTVAANTAPEPLERAPLAYENPAFLNGPDGRLIRIMAEYSEPLTRFRRERIQDTVVFFGSARFRGREEAEGALELLETLIRLSLRRALSSRPARQRLPLERRPICSASGPSRPSKWRATTRMRGGYPEC